METSELEDRLTEHLNSTILSRAATHHRFLTSVGDGTISKELLAYWLSQDRLYIAHAYPRFIGALITKIPFSSVHAPDSPEEHLTQRILKLLITALENVEREVSLFSETAEKHGLNMGCWGERKGTRDYTAEMARMASWGTLEEGLVFLWAMEKSTYTHTDAHASRRFTWMPGLMSKPFTTLVQHLEFSSFVQDLADMVDILDVVYNKREEIWRRKAEEIWKRVIELEEEFWPAESELIEEYLSRRH